MASDFGDEIGEYFLRNFKGPLFQAIKWSVATFGGTGLALLKAPKIFYDRYKMNEYGMQYDQSETIGDAALKRHILVEEFGVDEKDITQVKNSLLIKERVYEKYFGNTKEHVEFAKKLDELYRNPEKCREIAEAAETEYKLAEEFARKESKFNEENDMGKEIRDEINSDIEKHAHNLEERNDSPYESERIAKGDKELEKMQYQGFTISYMKDHKPDEHEMDYAIAHLYGTGLTDELGVTEKDIDEIEFCPNKDGAFDITYIDGEEAKASIHDLEVCNVGRREVVGYEPREYDNPEQGVQFREEQDRVEDSAVVSANDDPYIEQNREVKIYEGRDSDVHELEREAALNYMQENLADKNISEVHLGENPQTGNVDATFIDESGKAISAVDLEPKRQYVDEIGDVEPVKTSNVEDEIPNRKPGDRNDRTDARENKEYQIKDNIQERAKGAAAAPNVDKSAPSHGIKAPDKGER